MATTKSIKLTDILVNTDNYRFSPVTGQREAIERMVEDQGDKLFNLAEHIMVHGLNPNDKIQVALSGHDKSKFNVLEGNRRIVALKILHNPDSLDFDGQASLKKRFKKLHENHKSKIVSDIECTVYDDPSEADQWIKLKHTGANEGIGTVEWDKHQKERFEEKVEGKSSIAFQAVKLLHASPDVPREIKERLADLKITNLDRLISDPAVRDTLGLEISNGQLQSEVDKKEVVKGLTKIAKDLLDPKFDVKDIYTKEDRKKYLESFPKSSKPDLKKAIKRWQVGDTSGIPPYRPGPKKGTKRERKALIPRTCIMTINNPKVEAIYNELQKLHVEEFKNSVAVMFRVFVELSIDCYREAHKLSNTPSSSKSGTDLQQKFFQVINHLETAKIIDTGISQGIRTSIKEKNGIFGVDAWHGYVHNNRFSPIPQNLMTMWDNMQEFMERVWGNIK